MHWNIELKKKKKKEYNLFFLKNNINVAIDKNKNKNGKKKLDTFVSPSKLFESKRKVLWIKTIREMNFFNKPKKY